MKPFVLRVGWYQVGTESLYTVAESLYTVAPRESVCDEVEI